MGVPKKRVSRTRAKKRRTHYTLKAPTLVECPKCHELMQPHRVCPHCGYYNGKLVVKEVKEI
uniref:Large ribosomal subunit protein bL32 n=1 Tax=candidate division WOR-3 bacterium TaxID=2052148 RepID=A0A7C4U7C9_UNCW3